jgi:hypothetical protein
MHVQDQNYVDSQYELDSIKATLRTSGVCPICSTYFKGLKNHFINCFKKFKTTNNKPDTASSSHSTIEQANTVAHQLPEFPYEYSDFDFDKQKWKCQFCENFYKDLKSKPYANHLKAKHSDKLVSDFTNLLGENFFESNIVPTQQIEVDADFIENSQWLINIQKQCVDKRFNILHINVNSILGSVKFVSIESILNANFIDILCVQETKIGSDTPDSLFEYQNYNFFRRDRIRGGGGMLIFVKNPIKYFRISMTLFTKL